MNYELKGFLAAKFNTVQITEKFQKREFVVEIKNGEYSELIKLQLINDRCDLIDPYTEGQEITVHFNIKGRKWEKEGKISYFTNLEAWKIESLSAEVKEDVVDKIHPEIEDDSFPF